MAKEAEAATGGSRPEMRTARRTTGPTSTTNRTSRSLMTRSWPTRGHMTVFQHGALILPSVVAVFKIGDTQPTLWRDHLFRAEAVDTLTKDRHQFIMAVRPRT